LDEPAQDVRRLKLKIK